MNHNEAYAKHLLSCFDVFLRINEIRCLNLKHLRTQFYREVTPSLTTISDISNLAVRNQHRYEKVSTPISCSKIRRFEQKGLIVVWPQRKKIRNRKTLTLLSWILAYTMYFLYLTHILPYANVVMLEKPPWNHKQKLRKPLVRDYIIEPDWNSHLCS